MDVNLSRPKTPERLERDGYDEALVRWVEEVESKRMVVEFAGPPRGSRDPRAPGCFHTHQRSLVPA